MVRSDRFYSYMKKKIDKASNFNYLNTTVKDIDRNANQNYVKTDLGNFECSIVFSSIYEPKKYDFKKYPLLNQHFLGWTIETDNDTFDENKIRFMDFSIEQHK